MAVSQIEVSDLREQDERAWDSFVAGHPGGALTYAIGYRDLLKRTVPGEAVYLTAWEDGALTGVLPTFRMSGPHGDVINALPFFGSAGAPLIANDAAWEALSRAWRDMIADKTVIAAVSVGNPFGHLDRRLDHSTDDHRIGQFTRLDRDGGADALFDAFDSSARRNVRRAEKSGTHVTVDNGAVDVLQALHVDNMTAIGGRAKPPAFFDAVPEVFRPDADYRIYVAQRSGAQTAALLVFYFANTAEYYIPAIAHEAREDQPMALILWTAMCDAIDRGCRIWNWGGTWTTQTGVYRFKRKWGAEEIGYSYDIALRKDALAGKPLDRLLADYPGYYVAPAALLERWAEESRA